MPLTWVEGGRYDYYGAEIVCVRRYFDGPLEMVDLEWASDLFAGAPRWFRRTARTLAPSVTPRVTVTLGGVCRPDVCPHYPDYGEAIADAGPHAGQACCLGCGAPKPTDPPMPRTGPPPSRFRDPAVPSSGRSADGGRVPCVDVCVG